MALRKLTGSNNVPTRSVDLKLTLLQIAEELELERVSIYLFGSRRYKTGSIRSDIDLLFVSSRPLRAEEAQRIFDAEPYLDVFEVVGGEARSLINESRIRSESEALLLEKLDTIALFEEGDWQPTADEFAHQVVLGQRSPAATAIPLYDLYDAVPAERADLLVVTALTEEYQAVLQALGLSGSADASPTTRVEFEGWLVTVRNLQEMGSVGAALGARDALLRTKAAYVVLVGICAGIPNEVDVGDVVMPRTVLYFELGKVREGKIESADDQRHCDLQILNAASQLSGELAAQGIRLHATDAVMACGEKVISSAEFRDEQIRIRHRKIAAIDMESYGVARAAEDGKRKLTVIKGVCDLADEGKADDARANAASNAAEVLATLIARGIFVPAGAR